MKFELWYTYSDGTKLLVAQFHYRDDLNIFFEAITKNISEKTKQRYLVVEK